MPDPILVIGGGHAAAHLIAQLCKDGCQTPIRLITEEAHLPYQRPPLSKGFLAGDVSIERLQIKQADFFATQQVRVSLNTRVIQIDRHNKQVQTSDGNWLPYSKLALVTGSRVRKLAVPGSDLEGIHYLRNIADVQNIQRHWQAGKKLLIVGAGYIGLEVAAVAARQGLKVTVLEVANRVMNRTVAPEVSTFYQQVHQEEGVTIRTGTGLSHFEGKQQVQSVVATNGEQLDCDLVVVGVGILPNQELAQQADLVCDDGILVDEFAVTSDKNIVAAGDCTNHPNSIYNKRIRLESVHNAMEQGKTAAASLLGKPLAYQQVPWFWSDQYDLKLQMVGLIEGYDELVCRGDTSTRKFSLFYLKQGKLIAANCVSQPKEFMQVKKMIGTLPNIDSSILADSNRALEQAIVDI